MPSTTTPRRKTAARKARKTAPRRAQSRTRSTDAIQLIKKDHAEVNDLFRRYRGLGPRAFKRKQTTVNRIVHEISVHGEVEELVLYPAARRVLDDGSKLVKEAISEHKRLKTALAKLDRMDSDDDRYDDMVQTAFEDFRHHVREEEAASGMLAQMRRALDPDQRARLGRLLQSAKNAAPTRPHPHAPTSATAKLIVAPIAGLADRVKDVVEHRP